MNERKLRAPSKRRIKGLRAFCEWGEVSNQSYGCGTLGVVFTIILLKCGISSIGLAINQFVLCEGDGYGV